MAAAAPAIDTQAARTLDNHGVAHANAGLVESIYHLGHRTVGRRYRFIRKVIGDLEHEVSRVEVEVLGKASTAIRVLLDGSPKTETVRAVVQLAPQAHIAAPAREEIGVGNPIPFSQRPA